MRQERRAAHVAWPHLQQSAALLLLRPLRFQPGGPLLSGEACARNERVRGNRQVGPSGGREGAAARVDRQPGAGKRAPEDQEQRASPSGDPPAPSRKKGSLGRCLITYTQHDNCTRQGCLPRRRRGLPSRRRGHRRRCLAGIACICLADNQPCLCFKPVCCSVQHCLLCTACSHAVHRPQADHPRNAAHGLAQPRTPRPVSSPLPRHWPSEK